MALVSCIITRTTSSKSLVLSILPMPLYRIQYRLFPAKKGDISFYGLYFRINPHCATAKATFGLGALIS